MPDTHKKIALIFAIPGQDSSHPAELILEKGYKVHGLIRRAFTLRTKRIDRTRQYPHDPTRKPFLHHGHLLDGESLFSPIASIQPNEAYNLAAQSHVRASSYEPDTPVIHPGLECREC
jgi:GDPmannose 4,6-dehydratase